MLRAVVDDAAFEKGLKQFVNQYAWKQASTEDFRKVFETAERSEARLLLLAVD
jgi:aminopeptidase N